MVLVASAVGSRRGTAQSVAPVTLVTVSTAFNSPIGIDHHAPTNRLVLSVNYSSGMPYNFELVDALGNHAPFSDLSGLTDEIKIGTVREGPCRGGFTPGELFAGTGVPGEILRIAADGASADRPWVTLPGETGLMRGSLHHDAACVFGGDLAVVTSTGGVWRVTSAGRATRVAALGTHLEGATTVPDDPARYGPWAGRLLAGAEDARVVFAVAADGTTSAFDIGLAPEDIDIVPARANFFGVDFGAKRLVGAPSTEWADKEGDVVIAEESGGLWDVRWDGAAGAFNPVEIARVGQWEHVTFSTAGVVEIPTPEPPPPPAPIYVPILLEDTCRVRPLAAALVLDASTSMGRALADGVTKAEAARAAGRSFLEVLRTAQADARVAIVGFNDAAWIARPLTDDLVAAASALDGLVDRADQGTRLDLALEAGGRALAAAPAGADRVLVLLTDGLPNRVPTPAPAGRQEDAVLAVAAAVRALGIRIYTVGLGRADAVEIPDRINPALLAAVAGAPDRAFVAPDAATLDAAYRAIAGRAVCAGGGRWPALAAPGAP